MDEDRPRHGCKSFLKSGCGCLGLLLVLAVWAVWQMGEPQRRAQVVMEQLHPGMTPSEVLPLFTGRIVAQYDLDTAEGYQPVTREEFLAALEPPPPAAPTGGQLRVHILGTAPGRIAVVITFGPDGRLSEVEPPMLWD